MEWTHVVIKSLAIEAYETSKRLPGKVGPAIAGNGWPEYASMYAGQSLSLPKDQISRSDKFWADFAIVYDEDERHEVLTWLRIKTDSRATFQDYCEKNGLNDARYRRHIDKIFQKLAKYRNNRKPARFDTRVDDVKILDDKKQNRSPVHKSPNHIMLEGGKTEIDPDAPPIQYISKHRRSRNG